MCTGVCRPHHCSGHPWRNRRPSGVRCRIDLVGAVSPDEPGVDQLPPEQRVAAVALRLRRGAAGAHEARRRCGPERRGGPPLALLGGVVRAVAVVALDLPSPPLMMSSAPSRFAWARARISASLWRLYKPEARLVPSFCTAHRPSGLGSTVICGFLGMARTYPLYLRKTDGCTAGPRDAGGAVCTIHPPLVEYRCDGPLPVARRGHTPGSTRLSRLDHWHQAMPSRVETFRVHDVNWCETCGTGDQSGPVPQDGSRWPDTGRGAPRLQLPWKAQARRDEVELT